MLSHGQMLQHLVVDRDGVLNRESPDGWVTHQSEWTWEDGALAAMALCARSGIRVSIVTNQSCVGRGLTTRHAVDDLHEWMGDQLRSMGVDLVDVYVCPHAPDHGCGCRKPRAELVRCAMADSGVAKGSTVMVGDSWTDLAAGRAAGVLSLRVATGKGRHEDPASADGPTLHAVLHRFIRSAETVA